MHILQQISFAVLLVTASYLIGKRFQIIKQTIGLGKPLDRYDQSNKRLSTMFRIAFGQKKMFDRPIIGLLHLVVYIGFILINIEVVEILLDGLFGTHRLFAPVLSTFYPLLISFFEGLALGVIIVCIIFLIRRNITHTSRLQASNHRELTGFPSLDASIILFSEIILMVALLSMNAADGILQDRGYEHYPVVGTFTFSEYLKPLFSTWTDTSLVIYERLTWWFHITGILGFALYVSYSKHLHIFLAFPNTYFANLNPVGNIPNMPEVTTEVKIMLGLEQPNNEVTAEVARFGAKDIMDLTWKNLMDAYSCTECGRCTSQCPANLTGKALSPRKIMMDTRDRLEEVGANLKTNKGIFVDDGKSLYGDYISAEELRACTTCNACVQECPILISPMDIIISLRRYQIMEESNAPSSWNAMFSNMENNQAPWKFSPSDRFNWAEGIQ